MQEQDQSTTESPSRETAGRRGSGVDVMNPASLTKAINIAKQMLALVIFVFAKRAQRYVRTRNTTASSNQPTEPGRCPGKREVQCATAP